MAVGSAQVASTPTTGAPPAGQAASQSETPQALKAWWAGFKHKRKKEEPVNSSSKAPSQGIFGIPLAESIKYANVAISLIDEDGKTFIYGYVPIVVAKCGVFLKDRATDVEGIFRLSGSAKRIKELQTAFDSPDRYGKGLDWTGYTVHDAANVLRRYLNHLPQPIVPLELYERFREPLRDHFTHGGADGTVLEANKDFNHNAAIETYKQLIVELPPLNRQLLLYILDLLAVFASKSDVNLMTSANLAAIFQPGVLSHPTHDMSPEAYRLSQDVLIFLIDNQDSFLIGMSGTAADEKTVKEVSSGTIPKQPSTPAKSGVRRSASNASTTGEGKRISGIRRNVSTSSRNSRQSSQGPGTPLSGRFGDSSVHRSNTVPSKKSPAIPTSRFSRGPDSPSTPLALSPVLGDVSKRPAAFTERKIEDISTPSTPAEGLGLPTAAAATVVIPDRTVTSDNANTESSQLLAPPVKTRKVSDVILNLTAGPDKDGRQPNKLKKKRIPSNMSGNSSTASLVGEQSPGLLPASSPLRTPDIGAIDRPDPMDSIVPASADITPTAPDAEPKTPTAATATETTPFPDVKPTEQTLSPTRPGHAQQLSQATIRARSNSRTSAHSKSSVTDFSELDPDQTEEARATQKEKKRRWRFSHSAKKSKSPARLGSDAGGQSSSSFGSKHRSRKSISNDAPPGFDPVQSLSSTTTTITGGDSKHRSESRDKSRDKNRAGDGDDEREEKRGFLSKIKAKIDQAREDKRERDAEKERAKSPQRDTERSGSKHSLSATANEHVDARRPSIVQETIPESIEPESSDVVETTKHDVQPAETTQTKSVVSSEVPESSHQTHEPTTTQATIAGLATSVPSSAAPLVSQAATEGHDSNKQEQEPTTLKVEEPEQETKASDTHATPTATVIQPPTEHEVASAAPTEESTAPTTSSTTTEHTPPNTT